MSFLRRPSLESSSRLVCFSSSRSARALSLTRSLFQDVFWVTNSSLAYVDSTSNQAIIRVDNTTTLPYNEKRNSVKLFSKNWYQPGVVLVMDIAHLPVGCSVWPAFWTQGTNWPNNGEIDILETINDQTYSQFSLHTNSSSGSCTATTNSTLGMTGSFAQTTCQYQANYGSGCISQAAQGSAGAGFNSAGGGVFALEFATWGINGWFIPRSSVPSSLTSGMSSLDTSTLGEPSVSYSGSTCDVATFFGSQQITIDTTLCGEFLGEVFDEGEGGMLILSVRASASLGCPLPLQHPPFTRQSTFVSTPDPFYHFSAIELTLQRPGDDAGQNLGSSCAVPSGQTCYSYWVAGNPSTYDEAYVSRTAKFLLSPLSLQCSRQAPGFPGKSLPVLNLQTGLSLDATLSCHSLVFR